HTANARRDAREVFYRASEAEFFEAAKFNDVYPGGVHVAGIVELNGHLAMDHLRGSGRRRPAPAKRLKVADRSGICLGSSPMEESAPIMSTMGLALSESGPKQPSHGM